MSEDFKIQLTKPEWYLYRSGVEDGIAQLSRVLMEQWFKEEGDERLYFQKMQAAAREKSAEYLDIFSALQRARLPSRLRRAIIKAANGLAKLRGA
jgi:hypothetical protein